jgi:hypothetical protein
MSTLGNLEKVRLAIRASRCILSSASLAIVTAGIVRSDDRSYAADRQITHNRQIRWE